MKLVSIIIPTYNRTECVINLLVSLEKQDYQPFEVLVIDQSKSQNDSIIKALSFYKKNGRYIRTDKNGRSLAKNIGISESKGDIVVFCDDDIIVPENFISVHVSSLDKEGVGATSCKLVESGDKEEIIPVPLKITSYGKLINRPYSTWSGYVSSLNGGNMSFKREVLDRIGFFEELFIGTSMVEEPDIAYRVMEKGYKIYFNSSITVYHYPQHNGNVAIMSKNRSTWFNDFFYNLGFFYLKYGRIYNSPLIFFYSLAVLLKHSIRYSLSIFKYPNILCALYNGFKDGYHLYKDQIHNPYFTPRRIAVKIIN